MKFQARVGVQVWRPVWRDDVGQVKRRRHRLRHRGGDVIAAVIRNNK